MRHWHLGILIVALATCTLLLATLYRGSTPAHAFSPPANGFYVAVDCDTAAPGIQDSCSSGPAETARDVAVVFGNVDVPNSEVKSFQFALRANQASFNPRTGADANLNGNPDFNDAAFQSSGWNCGIIPPERDRNPDPLVAESSVYCFRGPGGMAIAAGTTLTLAAVHYDVIGTHTSDFDVMDVVVGDDTDSELLSCNPSSDAPGPCYTAHIGPPAPPTSTSTPTSVAATATPTNPPAPTATPTTGATSGFYVAIDCDTNTGGIQANCSSGPAEAARDVAVVFGNVNVPNSEVKSFQFTVRANQSSFNPRAGADANLNGNPDFNDSAFQPTDWNCGVIPPERDRNPDPSVAESTLYCFRGPGGLPIAAGTTLTLGAVHYDVIGTHTSDFDLVEVVVGDDTDSELLSCNPSSDAPGPCFSAHIGPPAATNTPPPNTTPSATATPTQTPLIENPTITPTSSSTPTATVAPLVDTDGDGMFDVYELTHPCLSINAPDGDGDPDGDGLTSLQESVLLTDACNADSDADGAPDGYEHSNSCLNPLVPDSSLDADGDGLSNSDERTRGTSPCAADSDGDGYDDAREVQLGENPTSYCGIMRADVNNSGNVDVIDLFLAAREAGPVPPHNPRMNQTNDGKIDVIDLFRIAQSANKNVSICP